jgi:hypothetical protein
VPRKYSGSSDRQQSPECMAKCFLGSIISEIHLASSVQNEVGQDCEMDQAFEK